MRISFIIFTYLRIYHPIADFNLVPPRTLSENSAGVVITVAEDKCWSLLIVYSLSGIILSSLHALILS
jgi:hypothetical protein